MQSDKLNRKFGQALFLSFLALVVVLLESAVQAERAVEDNTVTFYQGEKVLLLGGSGRTGRLILEKLVSMGVSVRATTRNVERAKLEIGQHYDWIEVDVTDPDSIAPAMKGVNIVISAIGSDGSGGQFVDYEGVANAVNAAKKEGINRFLLISSAGVTHGPDHFLNKNYDNLLEWKLKGEEHLRKSSLGYVIIRPTALVDEYDLETQYKSIFLLQGDQKFFGLLSRSDLADLAIEAAINPEAKGKTFEIIAAYVRAPDQWRTQFEHLKHDN